MAASPAQLQTIIGHTFKDPKILERALTHRSWAVENLPGEADENIRLVENESIEFLGDSVLGLVIAERLFKAHPRSDEGGLTLMKHSLVSTETLARVADSINLGDYLRVGRGEEKTGGRKKRALLANTMEAVIGAVFLDGGYSAARLFIGRIFDEEIKTADPKNSLDYKTMLQERLQAVKMQPPTYKVIETKGPPHARCFVVEAVWETGRTSAEGKTIKAAEMLAAEEAITILAKEDIEKR